MELSLNKEYEVTGTKSAIFSYEGARVQMRGKCEVEYVSEETLMHAYLNTHLAIEGMRKEAVERAREAPRIIVMGQSKASVTRILLNYSVRAGRAPMYVDLDPAEGNLALPGTIGAQLLDRLIDVEEGLQGLGESQPINYFYGNLNVADNMKLYKKVLGRLAYAVNGRLAVSAKEGGSGGAIICMPTEGEELVGELQELFKAQLVLVIGNERLFVTVGKLLQDRPGCTVLKLPKSGGVVAKDTAWRRQRQQFAFKKYFYGAKREYSPFSLVLSFDEVFLRRLGEDSLAPKSALPLGATRKVEGGKAAKVEPSASLLYSVLAVSWATSEEQVGEINTAGYVYVTGVDEGKRQLTVLSICPGKLPSQYLLVGNLKWIEK